METPTPYKTTIDTDDEYQAALKLVDELWDAEPGTADYDRLSTLVLQIEGYEDIHYPMPAPTLCHKVVSYYEQRGLVWPDAKDAVLWAMTELGEAVELLMARGRWVRNNPDAHPPFDKVEFGRELGDVVMMCVVAGMVEGVDVVEELEGKMEEKLQLCTH